MSILQSNSNVGDKPLKCVRKCFWYKSLLRYTVHDNTYHTGMYRNEESLEAQSTESSNHSEQLYYSLMIITIPTITLDS